MSKTAASLSAPNPAALKRIQLRDHFWPGSVSEVWNRKKVDGFTTIPRTLGLIMTLIESLTERDKGKDVSRVYFELWCRVWDQEGVVEILDDEAVAFASGFTTKSRNVRSWRERVDELAKLGFVRLARIGTKTHSFIFLPDPHKIVKKLHEDGRVDSSWWGAYTKRAVEIGYQRP